MATKQTNQATDPTRDKEAFQADVVREFGDSKTEQYRFTNGYGALVSYEHGEPYEVQPGIWKGDKLIPILAPHLGINRYGWDDPYPRHRKVVWWLKEIAAQPPDPRARL